MLLQSSSCISFQKPNNYPTTRCSSKINHFSFHTFQKILRKKHLLNWQYHSKNEKYIYMRNNIERNNDIGLVDFHVRY